MGGRICTKRQLVKDPTPAPPFEEGAPTRLQLFVVNDPTPAPPLEEGAPTRLQLSVVKDPTPAPPLEGRGYEHPGCTHDLLAWLLGVASWYDLLAWPLGMTSWRGLLV